MKINKSEDWFWWASLDGGERYAIGPCETRKLLVAEIRANAFPGEVIHILEATKKSFSYRPFDGDEIYDMLDNLNVEKLDPDGDGSVIDERVTAEQERELACALNDVLEAWVDKHGFRREEWAFADTRNDEFYVVQGAKKPSHD